MTLAAARRRLRYDLLILVLVLSCVFLVVQIVDLPHLVGLLVILTLSIAGSGWLVWRIRRVLSCSTGRQAEHRTEHGGSDGA